VERRSFSKLTNDWEPVILKALHNAAPGDFGSLNKDGTFFRIRTLTSVQIPQSVIKALVAKGAITLMQNNYYRIRSADE
jgi:hypothetical protein